MPWGAAYHGTDGKTANLPVPTGGGWGSKATVAPPAPPAKKSGGGGGGFFGALGHLLGQTGKDFADAAVQAPAGAVAIGKLLEQGTVAALTNDQPALYKNSKQITALGEGMVHQTADTLRHPLRHPGNTLLLGLPAAGSVARGAVAAARAAEVARAGEGAGAVLRAVAERPVYEPRTLTRGKADVQVGSSQSALGAGAQRATDTLLQARAASKPGGIADRLLLRKMGKAVTAETHTLQDVHNAHGAALTAIGNKLSPAEQKALQVVAEEAPLEQRITATSARVLGATGKARKAQQVELDLLHQAKPHLAEEAGKPVFGGAQAAKLNHVLETMRSVATSREELLKGLGRLTDESIAGRKSKAARVAIGQPLEHAVGAAPEVPGQMQLLHEEQAPLFEASADAVRIPDVATRRGVRSLGRPGSVGAQGTIGHLKAPGSTTHEYTGALRENAIRRQDTAQLVGESGMEAGKYAGLQHVHEFVRNVATPEPSSASDVAVRLEGLKSHERMPLEVRKFLDDPQQFFATATPQESASAFEGVRQRLFVNPAKLDPQAAAEFNDLKAAGKIGWVPKQLLGELAKPHIPLGGAGVKGVDAVNNASRFAILYLKPAYAIPNLLGNAALNVLQQGFAAVPNLARASRLNSHLGEGLTARIDTLMGEGFARSISAHGQGLGSAIVDKAASVWSKGVDTPFRRSSFLYEANRAGFKSPAQIEQLLTDPANVQKLVEVTQRANREIIDYANLTPTEREVVRRVVFFYPWIKGSTVYAGRMLREHPIKSGAVGQLGELGKRESDRQLGAVPSYLQGVFPVGDRLVNPNSAAILQTPAQVGEALAGLAGGDVGQVGELSNFLTPAAALAVAAVTRRDRGGYSYKPGTSVGGIAFDQLVKNLPQYVLGQRISDASNHKGQDRLYPPNIRDAIMQYLVGGVAPRKYNKGKLAELAHNERSRFTP